MKKFVLTLLVLLISGSILFAQERTKNDSEEKKESVTESTSKIEDINMDGEILDPVTGFPKIQNKPFGVLDEGFAFTTINRIINQEKHNRSNFYFKDSLAGMYLTVSTKNMMPMNSMFRLAVYYPLRFTFNGMEQVSSAVIQGAVDLFTGTIYELNMWNYIKFNLSPGLHFLYQYTERFHYLNLGLGAYASIRMPLAQHWTLLLNGIASLDYGNFGTNNIAEPYDIVWQYQVELGIKYSKKDKNKYSYIKPKEKN